MCIAYETKWPAAARNLIPLSRFPQGESRGGEGSPHAAACSAPAKTAGTSHAAAPPARGLRPLARSPWLASANVPPPAGRPGANMIARKKRMKDGRHVGLDFYDLLIEPIFPNNAIEKTQHERPRSGTKGDRLAQAETARTG